MREVILYGNLRKRFGKYFKLDVQNPAEAVQALSAVVPGFRSFFSLEAQRGSKYYVFAGKRNITEDELLHPVERDTAIRLVPVVEGSSGAVKFVLGAVIMAVGFFVQSPFVVKIGMSMMLSGAIQMLSPQPKTTQSSTTTDSSYIFNGAANTAGQGQPVPLLFGRMRVGSSVISSGLTSENIPV